MALRSFPLEAAMLHIAVWKAVPAPRSFFSGQAWHF
jgi:hypothetical protein